MSEVITAGAPRGNKNAAGKHKSPTGFSAEIHAEEARQWAAQACNDYKNADNQEQGRERASSLAEQASREARDASRAAAEEDSVSAHEHAQIAHEHAIKAWKSTGMESHRLEQQIKSHKDDATFHMKQTFLKASNPINESGVVQAEDGNVITASWSDVARQAPKTKEVIQAAGTSEGAKKGWENRRTGFRGLPHEEGDAYVVESRGIASLHHNASGHSSDHDSVEEAVEAGKDLPGVSKIHVYRERGGGDSVRRTNVHVKASDAWTEEVVQASGNSEGAKKGWTHRVHVRMTDKYAVGSDSRSYPNQEIRKARVTADSDEEAEKKVHEFYKKRGYKNFFTVQIEKNTGEDDSVTKASDPMNEQETIQAGDPTDLDPSVKATWSDAAREAAAEARKSHVGEAGITAIASHSVNAKRTGKLMAVVPGGDVNAAADHLESAGHTIHEVFPGDENSHPAVIFTAKSKATQASDMKTQEHFVNARDAIVACRDYGFSLGNTIQAKKVWRTDEPISFQWMPSGVHQITASYGRGQTNVPIELFVKCDKAGAERIQKSFEQITATNSRRPPFICIEHQAKERAGQPTGFAWGQIVHSGGVDEGIICTCLPSALGANNVNGKIHTSFSPTFDTDADYSMLKCSGCDKGRDRCKCSSPHVFTFARGARGSQENPAEVTRLDCQSVGSLTNWNAFKEILPVAAREPEAVKAGAPLGNRNAAGKHKHDAQLAMESAWDGHQSNDPSKAAQGAYDATRHADKADKAGAKSGTREDLRDASTAHGYAEEAHQAAHKATNSEHHKVLSDYHGKRSEELHEASNAAHKTNKSSDQSDSPSVKAVGTSEGAKKGWEHRERVRNSGRKAFEASDTAVERGSRKDHSDAAQAHKLASSNYETLVRDEQNPAMVHHWKGMSQMHKEISDHHTTKYQDMVSRNLQFATDSSPGLGESTKASEPTVPASVKAQHEAANAAALRANAAEATDDIRAEAMTAHAELITACETALVTAREEADRDTVYALKDLIAASNDEILKNGESVAENVFTRGVLAEARVRAMTLRIQPREERLEKAPATDVDSVYAQMAERVAATDKLLEGKTALPKTDDDVVAEITARTHQSAEAVTATGTSEGAEKGWLKRHEASSNGWEDYSKAEAETVHNSNESALVHRLRLTHRLKNKRETAVTRAVRAELKHRGVYKPEHDAP